MYQITSRNRHNCYSEMGCKILKDHLNKSMLLFIYVYLFCFENVPIFFNYFQIFKSNLHNTYVLTNELRINIVTGVFSSSLHALIDWIAFATPAYVLMIVCQLLSNICIIKKTINAIHFKSYTHVLDNTI